MLHAHLLQDTFIEKLLEFFVAVVDAELFETVQVKEFCKKYIMMIAFFNEDKTHYN